MANGRAESIDALTGLRAFGALWVVMHHVRPLVEQVVPGLPVAYVYAHVGYLGVDLFSFLSGFVIAHNYGDALAARRPGALRRFLVLRVARIFPLHLFAMLVLGLVVLRVSGFDPDNRALYTPGGFVAQLLLVHAWGLRAEEDWNVPSWTVSAEWLCYLAFPLVVLGLSRVRRSGPALLLACAAVAATLGALTALGHPRVDATMLLGALRIGGEFLAGALIQRAYAAGGLRQAPWGGWTGLAIAASLLLPLVSPAAAVFAFGGLVLALAHDRGPVSAPLRSRPIVYLGEISYSIYLMHWIVLKCVAQLGLRLAPGSLLALDLAAVLGVAVLTYHAIEAPSRRALRRRFAGPRAT